MLAPDEIEKPRYGIKHQILFFLINSIVASVLGGFKKQLRQLMFSSIVGAKAD